MLPQWIDRESIRLAARGDGGLHRPRPSDMDRQTISLPTRVDPFPACRVIDNAAHS